jgi:putative flippase GtrA
LNRCWIFVKTHFLTKKFLTFGVIGVVNTAIDTLVYLLFYNEIFPGIAFASKGFAFIIASVFSYFANAVFTFKPATKNAVQFAVVMAVFLARMLLTMALAAGIDFAVINWFGVDYDLYPIAETITPLFSSAVMIPLAYFALDVVYRKFGRSGTR